MILEHKIREKYGLAHIDREYKIALRAGGKHALTVCYNKLYIEYRSVYSHFFQYLREKH